uniref:MORN repeat-containing protein 1-like n=1 Tax=Saccoglossus kowalevskii TaxID=10224 RepID=A0ABM0GV57_SACKO|nr:PREDICTED: MORN repeat-containing protein 1-like [Saccoglossus kowalevskii]
MTGYGVYNYPNSFYRYEGEWKDGRKHGHGKLVMKDGSYYEGEFIHGEIEGHGTRYWSHNGNVYSGHFLNGELHGHGVMRYANGMEYRGEFQSNKKEGHGVLIEIDGSMYEGSFHSNQRHGEGQQTYVNGDRYIGDWINGYRQGSGEITFADKTIYDGQWRNDMFNGEGTYIHSSGMTYEGLWINGRPAVEADHIVILGDPVREMVQGTPFTIEIEMQSPDGELVEDHGREIQISAGFRHYTPSEGTPLFNLIEDIEEKPVATPYDYNIVNYPLTELGSMKLDERPLSPGAVTKSASNLGESSTAVEEEVAENGEVEEKPTENIVEEKTEETVAATMTEGEGGEIDVSIPTEGDEEKATSPRQQLELPEQETPVPPPVNTLRSEDGKVDFKDLVLPPAPQGYIPFTIMDQLEEENRNITRGKTTNLVAALKLGAKTGRSIDTDNIDPSKLENKETAKADARLAKQRREKLYGDERFARPGEYVIMVQDVTTPPFLGKTLTPAFMLVRITNALEKKPAKKARSSTKRNKPQDKT